jgi:GNAT superfamily N-acetyltransferase
MKWRLIQLHQLQAYIDSEEYKQSKYIPISKHRALSHLRNPRGKADDLVLVLVYEAGEMVGYLGVFADDLHFTTGVEHVGWLSCMWVNPTMRGKGIAKKLLQTVFEAWEYKILVTEFTPAAYGLYQRTEQFLDLAKPKGIRGYLRLNLHYLLPQKDEKWNKWKPFLGLVDGLFNGINDWRLKWKATKKVTFEYISEIDAESWTLVQETKQRELMNRGREELTWLVNNPWLLSGGLEDHNAQRYHFSAVAPLFSFLNIKIYDASKNQIAFLIVSIRGKNMKVPYAYFEAKYTDEVIAVLYQHLLELKLDMITVFHERLVAHIEDKPSPFFKKRAFQRHYIIGKVLGDALNKTPGFTIQDGDADAAFT